MKTSKKTNKKSKEQNKTQGLAVKALAVLTGLLIIGVGVLCTSPSKAADDVPYIPDIPDTDHETDTEPALTSYEETRVPDETLEPIETVESVTTDTDTGTPHTDTESTETLTDKVTEPVTTVTEAPVTRPPETTGQNETSHGSVGKQDYREYNGRSFADNETFVGEYKSDKVKIGVSNVRDGDLSYYICDIVVSSPKDFHTAFAAGKITGTDYPSRIAASAGAGFAVNGDFCGFRSYGIIIREGGMYRNKKADGWDLCYLNKYGDLIVCKNDKQDGKNLADEGVLQSWCFGPTLVEDYRALTKDEFNTPDLSRRAREPRTAIGQVDELHYIFLVVDAKRVRNGVGWNTVGGMTFEELANTFKGLGCKTAYNLDGGGSTTMYLNGRVANEPCMDGERAVSDIIYFK